MNSSLNSLFTVFLIRKKKSAIQLDYRQGRTRFSTSFIPVGQSIPEFTVRPVSIDWLNSFFFFFFFYVSFLYYSTISDYAIIKMNYSIFYIKKSESHVIITFNLIMPVSQYYVSNFGLCQIAIMPVSQDPKGLLKISDSRKKSRKPNRVKNLLYRCVHQRHQCTKVSLKPSTHLANFVNNFQDRKKEITYNKTLYFMMGKKFD